MKLKENPLLLRMIGITVLATAAVTLLLTALELLQRYSTAVESIHSSFDDSRAVHGAAISKDLWEFDSESITIHLRSILHGDVIVGASVFDQNGKGFSAGDTSFSKNTIRKKFALYYTREDGGTEVVGNLSIFADTGTLKRQILRELPLVVLNELLKMILIAVLLLVLFIRYFNRHLNRIITFTDQMSLSTLGEQLDLQRKKHPRNDELDRLVDAVNRMSSRVNEEIRRSQEAETQLSLSEEMYRQVFNAPDDGIIIHRISDGSIVDVNQSIVDLYGYSREELCAIPTPQLSSETEPYTSQNALAKMKEAANGEIQTFEWQARKKNGEFFWVYVHLRVITIRNEQRVLAFIRDITKQNRLEESLRQAQKMDAVGQLAGGVAHDFNNALAGILGAAEIMKLEDCSEEDRESCIDMITKAAGRAGELTKQLLTFSRKGVKVRRPIDAALAVEDTVSILRRTIDKRITVTVENRAENSTVVGDYSLLENCFINMGINAGHAMPSGGELIYSLANIYLDEEYCEISPFDIHPGEYLEVSVRDTGHGMSIETISHIFEPFFTTKEQGKGTGLGLSAVYGTVQDHSGAITVYSELGKGTVFHLYLPVKAAVGSVQKEESAAAHGTGTVLLVDDEEVIRITASALLTSLGYKVICAENGAVGVETYRENSSSIDLVILDMIMPVMGGREAFLKIREIDQSVPVIICSGFSREEDSEFLSLNGVTSFLRKPFRKAELADAAAKALQKKGVI